MTPYSLLLVQHLFDVFPQFPPLFKAWAMATLHSKRTNGDSGSNGKQEISENDAIEDGAIVRNLRWVAKNIQQNVDGFKPQELSNSVWAWATIGFGYDETSGLNVHNDYTYVVSDAPQEDRALVFDTLEIVAANALQRLDKFKASSRMFNRTSFAYCLHLSYTILHRRKSSIIFFGHMLVLVIGQMWLKSYSRELLVSSFLKLINRHTYILLTHFPAKDQLARRVHQFKAQDVGTTMWSLATVECPDPAAFRAGASRLNFSFIRLFKPQEMSNAVRTYATFLD